MSKSFARHYQSYKYIPWALALFVFAFGIIYTIVAGFLSEGMPVGMVIMQDGEQVESDFTLLWLLMQFMMLSLLFVVIVLVAFAWDAKKEPRPFMRKKAVDRDKVISQRKEEANRRMHTGWHKGFSRDHLKEHLLAKGHDEHEVERLLDEHKLK